jgi:hypothetical protein
MWHVHALMVDGKFFLTKLSGAIYPKYYGIDFPCYLERPPSVQQIFRAKKLKVLESRNS